MDNSNHGVIIDEPDMEESNRLSGVRYILSCFVTAILVAVFLRVLIFSIFLVPTGSMIPTIGVGDRIFSTGPLLNMTPVGNVEHGDIVIFSNDKNWGGDRDMDHLVKRVIGMSGDEVEGLSDGTILVNGEAIEEPYAVEAQQQPFAVQVPEGHLWVMGDNRGNSADSRAQEGDKAFISEDSVTGVVFWIMPNFLPSVTPNWTVTGK